MFKNKMVNIELKKEFLIGLLVVATTGILYFGINYLKGINMFRPTNYYYATFENVNGLLEASQITSRGVAIGNVHEIYYNYENPKAKVVVELQLDDQLTIPKGSKVLLNNKLLGGADLSLDLAFDGSGEYYSKGDTVASLAVPGMLDALSQEVMPKVAELIPQLDSLLLSLQTIASNRKITNAIDDLSSMSKNLNQVSAKLNVTMDRDVTPLMADAKVIAANFNKVSGNLAQIDFQITMSKVNSTLTSVNALSESIQNGGGTLSLLLKDRSLYDNINTTVGSANSLIQDLQANPKRYVQFSLIQRKDKSLSTKKD